MPRSRSSSLESMTRSVTVSLARKVPAWRNGVDQGGLAVVDVGDDGDVANDVQSYSRGLKMMARQVSSGVAQRKARRS